MSATNITFGQAMDLAMSGFKVARKLCDTKRIHYVLNDLYGARIKGITDMFGKNDNHNSHMAVTNSHGIQSQWFPSQADMVSADWFVVE